MKLKKEIQLNLFRKEPSAYGGTLWNSRKGRSRPRPLASKLTMHLVLKSNLAIGEKSFSLKSNKTKISKILRKFSEKNGVRILSLACVGNHLHFHIKLSKRELYKPFIRAVTSAISMAITGINKWTKNHQKEEEKFWMYRPFTRIIESFRAVLNMKDYMLVNELEGLGVDKINARLMISRGEFG